jgi:hypothetical protein
VSAVFAQAQQPKPEDPEDEKLFGLWLDQGVSVPFSGDKSLEIEFHERFDEGGSKLFEYFVQAGFAFRPRSWLTRFPFIGINGFPVIRQLPMRTGCSSTPL